MAISKKPAVKIPVTLETGKAEKKAKGFSKSMVKSFAVLGGAVAGAAVAYKAMSAALGSAISLTKEAVKLAGVQEKAERNLAQAIRLRQTFTEQEFIALQRFNFETQQATAIGDEELLRLQKQLTMQGVEKDMLEAVTKATVGLAQIKGQGLADAGTLLARVLKGEVKALKRYGIEVDTVSEAMDTLTGFFALAADETQTFTGQQKLLTANWGDMLEEFGRTLWQAPEVRRVMRDLNRIVIDLSKTIVKNQPEIVRFWDSMVEGSKRTLISLKFLAQTAGELFKSGGPAMFIFGGGLGRTVDRFRGMSDRQPYTEPLFTMTDEANRIQPPAAIGAGTVLRDPSFVQGGETPAQKAAARAAKTRRKRAASAAAKERKAQELAQVALEETFLKNLVARDEARRAQKRELAGLELAQADELNALRFEAELEAFDKRQALKDAELEATENFMTDLKLIGVSGMTDFITSMTVSILEGSEDLGSSLQRVFGGMLQAFGGMLVSLGTAAFLAATASTAVPMAWPFTGGPPGVLGSLGIIAAGATLTGVGSYMRSTAGKATEDGKRLTDYSNRLGRNSEADRPGVPRGGPQNTSAVYNINFNGALPGSERRIAREIRRIVGGGEMSGAYS